MKSRPLSMCPELVPAVLDGRKTMTRRPIRDALVVDRIEHCPGFLEDLRRVRCPLGAVGDSLWLRERARVVWWSGPSDGDSTVRLNYEADSAAAEVVWPVRLLPPIVGHCVPNGVHREGSRWSGVIIEARVERVRDITEEDARAEGVDEWLAFEMGLVTLVDDRRPYPVKWFNALWSRLYPGSWERNDLVWAVRWTPTPA